MISILSKLLVLGSNNVARGGSTTVIPGIGTEKPCENCDSFIHTDCMTYYYIINTLHPPYKIKYPTQIKKKCSIHTQVPTHNSIEFKIVQ